MFSTLSNGVIVHLISYQVCPILQRGRKIVGFWSPRSKPHEVIHRYCNWWQFSFLMVNLNSGELIKVFSRMVLSPSYYPFCFPGLSSASWPCPYVFVTMPPPLPNSQQHSGAGSAIFVVSFRLKLQESPTWIAELSSPHGSSLYYGCFCLGPDESGFTWTAGFSWFCSKQTKQTC